MAFSGFLTLLTVFTVLLVLCNADPEARLLNGTDVDNLRQFPFYVSITPDGFSKTRCGGSILNAQWILTSAECVKDFARVEVFFEKENESTRPITGFSMTVSKDQVYVYPTNQDDLALIKLPMRLLFSDTISPVTISRSSIDTFGSKFAVMPGHESSYEFVPPPYTEIVGNLTYGMFNILDQSTCKQEFKAGRFNEYNELCAEAWGSNPNSPCERDYGSPLIVGWPAKSELVGMFSSHSPNCVSGIRYIFTFVPKYLTWIETMIQG